MSIYKRSLCLTFSMCLAILISGCHVTRTQNEVHYLAELTTVEQVDMNIELRLTDEFRMAQLVHKEQGSTFYTPLGNPLSKNTEIVARKAFTKVIVSNADVNAPALNPDIQAVLIPEVATVKCDRPLTIFSTQTTTLHLSWTLKRPDGSLLWTTTVKAIGKGPIGALFTNRNAGAKQIRNLLQDVSEKSLDKLVSSSIIQQYAESIKKNRNQ